MATLGIALSNQGALHFSGKRGAHVAEAEQLLQTAASGLAAHPLRGPAHVDTQWAQQALQDVGALRQILGHTTDDAAAGGGDDGMGRRGGEATARTRRQRHTIIVREHTAPAPQARGLSYDDYYAEWRKAATPVPASDSRKGVRQTKLRAMRAPPPLTLLASSKTRK